MWFPLSGGHPVNYMLFGKYIMELHMCKNCNFVVPVKYTYSVHFLTPHVPCVLMHAATKQHLLCKKTRVS